MSMEWSKVSLKFNYFLNKSGSLRIIIKPTFTFLNVVLYFWSSRQIIREVNPLREYIKETESQRVGHLTFINLVSKTEGMT